MADGFVQQNTRPARTKHHGHFTRRGGNGIKVHNSLTKRFINRLFPGFLIKETVIADPAAFAMRTGFHAVALFDNDRNVKANQRADIANALPTRTPDLHGLPVTGNRCGYLNNARITGPGIGINLGQKVNLGLERCFAKRVHIGIKRHIGAD